MAEEPVPRWVEAVCLVPVTFRAGDVSVVDLFKAAAPPLDDAQRFVASVRPFVRARPRLVDAWHVYSLDKRSSPSPYLEILDESSVVGFYGDEGEQDVQRYGDAVDACTDFIYREANWVLLGRRVLPPDLAM
jgi:hypothetical protein